MHAVQYTEHGGREVITYEEYPDPSPLRGEVLIDVKATALNHLDVWIRRGMPGLDLEMPHIPGSDAAGIVAATGDDVTRVEPGDRVAVLAGIASDTDPATRSGDPTLAADYRVLGEHVPGLHAEEVTVPEQTVLPVPDHVDWETAAGAPLVFGTAWRMLIDRGDVTASEDVLVLGASGGVGHAAVQIADFAGATVYATGSTQAKLDAASQLGADYTINYEQEPFHRRAKELTDGRGVDVVVDHVGADTWTQSQKSLAKGGRLLTCGATTGPTPETNINRVFWRQLSIIGSTMCTPGQADTVLEHVWDGTFNVEIRDVLPMSEVATGHQLLEDRQGFGKVILVPDSEL